MLDKKFKNYYIIISFILFILLIIYMGYSYYLSYISNNLEFNLTSYKCKFTIGYDRVHKENGVFMKFSSNTVFKGYFKQYSAFMSENKFKSTFENAVNEYLENHADRLKTGDITYDENGKIKINMDNFIENHKNDFLFQELIIKHFVDTLCPVELELNSKNDKSHSNEIYQNLIKANYNIPIKSDLDEYFSHTRRSVFVDVFSKEKITLTKYFCSYYQNLKI